MKRLKDLFFVFFSSGTHQGLDEGKRFAIQIANLDAILSFFTLFQYFILSLKSPSILTAFYILGCLIVCLGFTLIRQQRYDLGRIIIHLNGIAQVFISVDSFLPGSGLEYYYFMGLTIPFVTFSLEEQWKGIILSILVAVACLVQIYLGTGYFVTAIQATDADQLINVGTVMIYMILIFSIVRWQLGKTRKELKKQASELVHSSNLIALGEMSGEIAHEINNPLQALIFQTEVLKHQLGQKNVNLEEFAPRFHSINSTIIKMGKIIKGLKDLSRDSYDDPEQMASLEEILEDVLAISSEKLRQLDVELRVLGDTKYKFRTRSIQVSQVFLNLINNSLDAIRNLEERWIRIEANVSKKMIIISVSDSGHGISSEVSEQMMKPFYTTKQPNLGTGLGLAISSNIIHKNGGRFLHDPKSKNTTFIIELPLR